MAKYKIFGTTSKELTLPTTKPETSLDFVNSQCIDPSYTFTRNSSGTYVGDDGLIKTAAVNEPRFDYDPATGESLGLLVEEARTNYHRYSTNFANWTANIAGSTLAPTVETLDPAGGTGAYLCFGVMERTSETGPGSGASYPFRGAIFIKKHPLGSNDFAFLLTAAGGDAAVLFNFDTEIISNSGSPQGATVQKFANGWYRLGFHITPGSTSWRTVIYASVASNNYAYVYGMQIEWGTFNTSYIPTSGSTVTRQPDQLVLNRTLNPQGAFYIEPNTTGTSLVADNGSSTISPPQGTKSALFYNTSRTLSMSSSTQPVEGSYDVPQNLNRVSLGFDRLGNTGYINGHLKKFMYYGSPVTEDNLRSLTGNTRPTFRFGLEQIVTNGLVLNLDAANPASYPGSGTTWTDLSGNGNNGTLVNGVGYNSGNGGSIVFDGVDDFINITQNTAYQFSNTQAFSLNLWVRCTATSGAPVMFAYALTGGRGYYFTIDVNVLRTNAFFFDYFDGSVFRGIQGNNNSITMNSWVNLVATSSSNSVNDMKVYQNGVLTSFTDRGTSSPSAINYDTLPMRIGARGDGGYFTGNISQVSIYNRALTAAEIQQNFTATRSRFGI